MRINRSVVIVVILFMMVLAACGQAQVEEKAEATDSPAFVESETLIPTADVQYDAYAFYKNLQTGLISHDYEGLQRLMHEPFTIAGWQAESSQFDAAGSIALLRSEFLPDYTAVRFSPIENMQDLLGGMDLYAMWGANVNIVNVLYSQGWGKDGSAEALLLVSQAENGIYTWYGVLYAPHGFSAEPDEVPSQQTTTDEIQVDEDVAMFENQLVSLLASAQDDAALASMMSDIFVIEGWLGSGSPWTPSEAVTQIRSGCLPSPSPEQYFLSIDNTAILQSVDVYASFKDVAGFIHSRGWGGNGTDEVLLIIARTPEGDLRWSHLVIAPNGFVMLP